MRPGVIAAGLIVLALGAAMLLDTAGMMPAHGGRLVAPFVLIVLGSLIVLDQRSFGCRGREDDDGGPVRRRRRRGAAGGIWLIGLGAWMLVSQAHLFGLSYATSWPLIVILAGVMIVIRGIR